MSRLRPLLLALLPALLPPPAAAAEIAEIEAPREVLYRAARDLDGDGKEELLLVASGEAWLWRGRDGRYPSKPDAVLALPDGAALFDVDGKGLLVRSSEGYFALAPGAPPERLPWRSGPGLPRRPGNLLWRGMREDIDRDGAPDLVDVSREGCRLEFGDGASLLLPSPPRGSNDAASSILSERHVARIAFAAWATGEFDAELGPDFALATDAGIEVFPGDERGRPRIDRLFRIDLPEARSADLTFVDWNRDGRTDLLAVERKKGTATVLVADRARGLAAAARRELRLPGEMRYPVTEDLDGDGLRDLALPFFPTPTVQDAVRWFVRGEVAIEVPVFLNRGGRECFPRLADTTVTVPVRLRVGADAAGRFSVTGLVVAEPAGDFDGDGRKDLLVSEAPDRLVIHRGVPVTVFHEKPAARIEVPDASPYDTVATLACDLDGDRLSDIIVHYRGAGRLPDKVFLILSRKR